MLSLCRSRGKWTMNEIWSVSGRWTSRSPPDRVFGSMNDPADERVVHLPTVSSGKWTIGRWTIRSSAGYRSSGQCFVLLPTESSDQWFVHLPDTDLWIIFHVTCIGSVLVARGNRNDSFIFRLGLRIRIFGSFPTWPAFNESFLFPWLSLCKSRCVATRKWTNLFLRGLVTLESL